MNSQHDETTYAALLAVARDSLDLIGERLDFQPRGEAVDRSDEVRADLRRWQGLWQDFVTRADLADRYRWELKQRMGRAAREFETDLDQPAPILRTCIERARNSLYAEVWRS